MQKVDLRMVFLGSPAFAVPSLEALVREGYPIVAVYTQPDRPAGRGRILVPPPVKEAAQRLRIPVVQPASFKAAEAVSELAAFRPDVIVVAAYGQILPRAVLDLPRGESINVHASLLPRHRGAAPVAAAILAGDDFTGVSIMLVEKRLDAGPVLARAAIPILPADTTGTLTEKLSGVGASLLLEALNRWLRKEIKPQPQNEAEATYFPQMEKAAGEIDWHMAALAIWRRVRAYNPWPGAFTRWRGRQIKILAAVPLSAADCPGAETGGRVVALKRDDAAFGIVTGDGVLGVLEVQLQGKRAMTSAEFIRGQPAIIGMILPT